MAWTKQQRASYQVGLKAGKKQPKQRRQYKRRMTKEQKHAYGVALYGKEAVAEYQAGVDYAKNVKAHIKEYATPAQRKGFYANFNSTKPKRRTSRRRYNRY